MPILDVSDITVRFGGIVALSELSFGIEEGQICGLIGPNGAGKTTLFNVVSRIYDPTEGSVTFNGEDLLALAPHEISTKACSAPSRTWRSDRSSRSSNVMVGGAFPQQGWIREVDPPGLAPRPGNHAQGRAYAALEELDLHQFAFTRRRPAGQHAQAALLARALIGEPSCSCSTSRPAASHSEVDELADVIKQIRGSQPHRAPGRTPHAHG
ncbi:MAG: ATP-binding cassette domain-containing protein [Acidimicrobiales bacterium]